MEARRADNQSVTGKLLNACPDPGLDPGITGSSLLPFGVKQLPLFGQSIDLPEWAAGQQPRPLGPVLIYRR